MLRDATHFQGCDLNVSINKLRGRAGSPVPVRSPTWSISSYTRASGRQITSLTSPCEETAPAISYRGCHLWFGRQRTWSERAASNRAAIWNRIRVVREFPLCNIYLFSSQGAWHMNLGNFQKHWINLHSLELALRSKRGGVVGVSKTSVYLE